MRCIRLVAFGLIALVLLTAACAGDTGDPPDPPVPADHLADTTAAGACDVERPDCDDTVEPDGTEPGAQSSGVAVDGGLTVAEALATTAMGVLAVQGFIVDDGSEARLCEALAESYPPQCGGASMPVAGYEAALTVPLTQAQGVAWTDLPATLFGELVDGTFVVDPTASG